MHDHAPVFAGLIDLIVLVRLWDVVKRLFLSFYASKPPFRIPAGLVMALLAFGVFLVVAGATSAKRGRHWSLKLLGIAIAAAVGAWVLMGGRTEVLGFFVVILLVLKFLSGVTLVLGFLRSAWVWILILTAILVSATGYAEPEWFGTAIASLASFVGAWSLFMKAEEFSPGKKGSRWNRMTAAGWVACLFAAGTLETRGLGGYAREFQLAGMIVGAALLILVPSLLIGGGKVRVHVMRK